MEVAGTGGVGSSVTEVSPRGVERREPAVACFVEEGGQLGVGTWVLPTGSVGWVLASREPDTQDLSMLLPGAQWLQLQVL